LQAGANGGNRRHPRRQDGTIRHRILDDAFGRLLEGVREHHVPCLERFREGAILLGVVQAQHESATPKAALASVLSRSAFSSSVEPRVNAFGNQATTTARSRSESGTVTVPMPHHAELFLGTLSSMIRQSGVPRSAFESW
jgi:hypothetical protein